MSDQEPINRSQIASRLRAAREAAGLTQGQVAKLVKLHRPTISEVEAGRRKVTGEELSTLGRVYGVTVEWLIHGSTPGVEPDEERIMLAARQLSKMGEKDLEKLMALIRMLRKSGGTR
ncbi:helix-turn-helix transcriptional regulator [Candidatus Sumerlaeota bacterium]|nr:helix-turn-helix transcriptional regulator [Candidatus Sumerlaeota bacterium]